MKYSICTLLIIFCSTFALAQRPHAPEQNRDQTRHELISYNNAETLGSGNRTSSTYFQSLDGAWQYRVLPVGETVEKALNSTEGWNTIDTPQSTAIQGKVVIYKHNYKRPFAWVDREIFVRLSSVSAPYDIYINGQKRGFNASSRTGSEFNITKFSAEGNNTLAIVVYTDHVATALNAQAARGAQLGNVFVTAQPRVRMRDVIVDASVSGRAGLMSIGIIVKSHMLNPKEVEVYCDVYNPQGDKVFSGRRDARFQMKLEDTVRFFENIQSVEPWSFETPNLYRVEAKIQNEGRYGEYITFKVGFSDVELDGKNFIINGFKVPVAIKDYNPTQSHEATIREIETLKKDGYNTIRISKPVPESFYSLCDSIGIFVCPTADINTAAATSPLNAANDPRYEYLIGDRVANLYHIAKSHPSVIMFSLAGDNTPNGYNMKQAYLALRGLEQHRPISFQGARSRWNNDIDTRLYSQPAEVRKLIEHSNISSNGAVTIKNTSVMTPLDGAEFIIWSDKSHKKILLSGTLEVNLAPGNTTQVVVPIGKLKLKPANVIEIKAKN